VSQEKSMVTQICTLAAINIHLNAVKFKALDVQFVHMWVG
jgi:hypothetical protein